MKECLLLRRKANRANKEGKMETRRAYTVNGKFGLYTDNEIFLASRSRIKREQAEHDNDDEKEQLEIET